jgi:hypothetical protein
VGYHTQSLSLLIRVLPSRPSYLPKNKYYHRGIRISIYEFKGDKNTPLQSAKATVNATRILFVLESVYEIRIWVHIFKVL